MPALNAEHVKQAIMKWPGLYETNGGIKVLAVPVSQMTKQLREAGWRGLGRQFGDASIYEAFGLQVVEARYIGGVRLKAFCDVVVARWECEGLKRYDAHVQDWLAQ